MQGTSCWLKVYELANLCLNMILETQPQRQPRALLIIINDTGRCGRIGMENRPEVGSGGSYCSGARPLLRFRSPLLNQYAGRALRRAATW